MGQYGSFPASIVTKPDLARCGLVAGLLWYQARALADSYGRLVADGETLVSQAMLHWALKGQTDEQGVAQARDQLAEAGLWHRYTVDGQIYAEYVDWDGEQPRQSELGKRGKPQHPDDPGRPELSWLERPHKPGTRKQQPKPTPPHGSADLPAGPPEAPPSQAVVVPTVAEAQQAPRRLESLPQPQPVQAVAGMPDGFAQLARAHEQHAARPLTTDDQTKLLTALHDAMAAGVEWQTLLTIMKEKQDEFKPTGAMPRIKGIGYYVMPWDKHIRDALRDREAPTPKARPTIAPPRQPLEEEDPRDRIRRKREAMTGGTAYAAG